MEIAKALTKEHAWQSFLDGSSDAYAEIYDDHFHLLNDFGLRLHNDREMVKDCIQDLFVKLWNNRQQLAAVQSVKSYLFTSLRNSLINKLSSADIKNKAAHINPEDMDFLLEYSAEEQTIDHETDKAQALQLLAAMNTLTARQKECIYLRYYVGLEYEEIADMMQISRKASYKLLARSLDMLKSYIRKTYSFLFLPI